MTRRRWLWLLVALPLLAGLVRLRFDADIFNLLPASLPAVRGLQLQQQNFANARELLVTVQSDDAEIASATARAIAGRLSAQTNLIRAARWQPPWLDRPEDGAENLAWLWLQQPPAEFARLSARLASTNLPAELASVRDLLATSLDPQELARRSYDPLGLTQLPAAAGAAGFDTGAGIFANTDGTYRVMFAEPADERMNYRAAAAWVAAVHRATEEALVSLPKEQSAVRIAYTGGPAFLAEISTGMESDLQSSVLSTVAVIAALFWFAHRSWRPLGWLIVSLGLTLAITMALGGLFFGTLNVVSLGFAAVLLGLAVDYGLVSYQEFAAAPDLSAREIRHEVAPGISYSAATTAGTFLLLGFAGLPGLAQLGVLTAVGLLVGAAVMLFVFLPLVAKVRPTRTSPEIHSSASRRQLGWLPTLVIAGFIVGTLVWRGLPVITASTDPLRPRQSAAYDAMDQLKTQFGRTNDPLWLMFAGTNQIVVAEQLAAAQSALTTAQTKGEIASFTLPTGFWPRPDYAAQNRATASELARRSDELRTATLAAGFTTNSLMLADGILGAWRNGFSSTTTPWPTNSTARWLVSQFAARTADGQWLALGIAQPVAGFGLRTSDFRPPPGVLVTSWNSLGAALLAHVAQRIVWVTSLIATMLVGCLWLAFRNWREVVLSLAALALSFALLLAMMAVIGWSWNLLSLVALPLLLGSSVDSTIHVQLALRRHGPDLRSLWRITGKALLLCAGANIAGFGSLAWSNNAGLASLDLVCAVGVGCVFVVCVGLLPTWWRVFAGQRDAEIPRPAKSSRFYGASAWRIGRALGLLLPKPLIGSLAQFGALLYLKARPARFAVVVENLLPVFAGDREAATRAAGENFARFARKLVDLWRYEAGAAEAEAVEPGEGWEHFSAARNTGRGLLLVTPHLGNWEFGAPLLARHGVRPLVLTAPEPESRLTEIRTAARARLGIDTLVVGGDPFAFVEVIKRLQAGGVVALLLDRPTPATAVAVEFFGRPFAASIAVAELARASGCVVLPTYIIHEPAGYRAHTLAPVDYDRRTLADRAARVEFTARILRVFEPAVRQHAGQWFHFVPVWPGKVAG